MPGEESDTPCLNRWLPKCLPRKLPVDEHMLKRKPQALNSTNSDLLVKPPPTLRPLAINKTPSAWRALLLLRGIGLGLPENQGSALAGYPCCKPSTPKPKP